MHLAAKSHKPTDVFRRCPQVAVTQTQRQRQAQHFNEPILVWQRSSGIAHKLQPPTGTIRKHMDNSSESPMILYLSTGTATNCKANGLPPGLEPEATSCTVPFCPVASAPFILP